MHRIRRTLFCLFLLLNSITTIAQNQNPPQILWQEYCDSTFVFQITNKEAEKFLKNSQIINTLLYNHVATFDQEWNDAPELGHFIYANIKQANINFRYMPQMPFQVFLFKEYGVLTLQVLDANGDIRKDAKIRIQNKRWRFFDSHVKFDEATQTYRIDDWSENTNRILTVELDKFKAIFNLTKHLVNPYQSDYGGNNTTPSFYSYMITDKNRYKPNETVRFKSYALTSKKKAIKDDLSVWINSSLYQYKKIMDISPYNPGGFAGEINLHDSLELTLDRNYNIQLRDQVGRIVASTSFKYEDYTLHENKMEVKSEAIHYFPDDHKIEIKVTDANGLIMPDLKAEISICREYVNNSYVELLTMPLVIHQEQIKLDNSKPTVYSIPASYFEQMDGGYSVKVEALTNDGQLLTSQKAVEFYKSKYNITCETEKDSISFKFFDLGKEKSAVGRLYINDKDEYQEIQFPFKQKFNQAVEKYTAEVPEYHVRYPFSSENVDTKLAINGGIVKDSLKLQLVNPLKLDISWFLYEGNELINNGSGKEFSFQKSYIDMDITYYLEIFYTIGGREQVFRKIYTPKKEYLNIETNLPDRVFPGQTIDTHIKVSDSRGKGQKNVDLTAFAYNSLLDYNVPDLPYFGNMPKGREQRNSYTLSKRSINISLGLEQSNYDFWNNIAHLDKLPYYQFLYPDPRLHEGKVYSASQVKKGLNIPYHDIFKYTIDTPDGTTEFAPYVMKDGKQQTVYAIELDDKPVYFSWTEQPQKYSFLTDSENYHKILIRLFDEAIIIDNYCFDRGKKTIMSINLKNMPQSKHVRSIEMYNSYRSYSYSSPFSLSENEKARYKHYISSLPIEDNRYCYLSKDSIQYPIHEPMFSAYRANMMVGPLDEGEYSYMDKITYFHEGGFAYKYSKNVVYKYPVDVTPTIHNTYYTSTLPQIRSLNDFHLTPTEFLRRFRTFESEAKWNPNTISLTNTRIKLPIEKEKTGVHSLILRNTENSKLFVPIYKGKILAYYSDENSNYLFGMKDMVYGDYDVFLLYNNGNYLRYNKVPLQKDLFVYLDMTKCEEQPKDSISNKWLEYQIYSPSYQGYSLNQTESSPRIHQSYYTKSKTNATNDVTGIVTDDTGEPLIGVSIYIKGKPIGTMTDIDGKFVLGLQGQREKIVVSYIGYKTQEIEVQRGTIIEIVLTEDSQLLDEVVVVGYGVRRKSQLTSSMSYYSSDDYLGAGRVPEEDLEESEDGEAIAEDAEELLYQELMHLDGMRSNFSDVGFWQPALVTDKKGEVNFSFTIPDNITQWNAVVYAMNRKLKTGTTRKSIKSYKPLMAELKTPQFLVVDDESNFATSIRNYTKDKTILGNIVFTQAGDTLKNEHIEFDASYQNLLTVKAPDTDSLKTNYRFTRNDGYSDGEQRTIPINPLGTEIAEGSLDFLSNKGDSKTIEAQSNEEIHVSLISRPLNIYVDDAKSLIDYKYACNEQLASKLIGLLNYKLYMEYTGEKFAYDKQVLDIISRLVKNQNSAKLWSWWGRDNSNVSHWMSAHILRALSMAKKSGYQVNLDIKSVEYDYIDIHTFRGENLHDIDILSALVDWGTEQSYEDIIKLFEHRIANIEAREDSLVQIYQKTKDPYKYARKNSYMKEKLLLTEMRQKLNLDYDKSIITNNLKKDVYGQVRLVDSLYCRYWYGNADASNIIAYRIIKRDSTLMHYKEPMQMSILSTKRYGWNTYQTSSAVISILPDLLAESTKSDNVASVTLTGSENKTITEFPYETVVKSGEKLQITKTSGIPIFYSSYKIKRRTQQQFGDAFEITTSLSSNILEKGVPVTLFVDIKVKEENAEYVMLEIPIPAGCIYNEDSKKTSMLGYYRNNETHREYFKDYTAIFCSKLAEGTYRFQVDLIPRYSGSYTLNPAKIEMMYFPVINANNDLRKVAINDRED